MLHFSPRLWRWRMLFDNLIAETALLGNRCRTDAPCLCSSQRGQRRSDRFVVRASACSLTPVPCSQRADFLISLCFRLNAEPTNNALCTPLHPSTAQTKPAAKHPSGPILLNPTSKFAKTFLLIAASDSRSVSPFSLLIFNLVPHDSRRFA